jgi:hypothetical protein
VAVRDYVEGVKLAPSQEIERTQQDDELDLGYRELITLLPKNKTPVGLLFNSHVSGEAFSLQLMMLRSPKP